MYVLGIEIRYDNRRYSHLKSLLFICIIITYMLLHFLKHTT